MPWPFHNIISRTWLPVVLADALRDETMKPQLAGFTGFPNEWDPTETANTLAEWNSLTAAMGQAPTMMLTYIDYTHPLSGWVTNDTEWEINSFARGPWLPGEITPIIGIPMALQGDNADTDFKDIASGQWDQIIDGVFQAWSNAGYKAIDIRPGHEMNGNWYPWSVTPQNVADYVAAFQHIASLAHNFSGLSIQVVWSPNSVSLTSLPVSSYYPGNASVDVIGIDEYGAPLGWDGAPSAVPTSSADYTLSTALAMAKSDGKPFALAETGGTDAIFPSNLASVVAASGVQVAYVALWDYNDSSLPGSSGQLEWSSKYPATAAAWRQAFATISAGSSVSPVPSPSPSIITGSGSDTLVLSISEDAYANGDGTSDANGDAAFIVSVDGKQLAGTFYATTPHSTGASQDFTFKGNWAPGAHTVTVAFLNDSWGGTASTDRNLFVNDVTYDGTDTKQSAALYSTGSQTFSVTDSTAIPPTVTGGGSDSLVVKVSEDYYLANAQFTVSVDGKQLGGTFTATTLHASGNSQTFAFAGDFGSGQHTVSVNFLNDAWAGTPATDRNLYVNDIVYNGTDTGQSAALMGQGAKTFSVSGGTAPSVSETGDHGSLQKNLSQTGSYTVGGDTFVLGSGNAAVTLGAGASQIKFVGPGSVTLTGGAGQATVTADAGNNKFVAGAGSLDVAGGAGKDAYVFHTTSGLLTLRDFSLAKGDTLTIDKSLQGSLHETSDGVGGVMLSFGTAGHGVDIHGVAAMPTSNIAWT
jgi:Ca-dependent carbohydrate-binding module xylan-binding/Glycosyl hydrolase family 26